MRLGLPKNRRGIITLGAGRMPVYRCSVPIRKFQMLTTAALLACLLSASEPPAKSPATPAVPLRVEVGYGVRVAMPLLGQAGTADKQLQQQVFAFYVGWFGR
jgi:hypothetical protein